MGGTDKISDKIQLEFYEIPYRNLGVFSCNLASNMVEFRMLKTATESDVFHEQKHPLLEERDDLHSAYIETIEYQLQEALNRCGLYEEKHNHLKDEYERLDSQLSELKRLRFGKKSERFINSDELQEPLFPDMVSENNTQNDDGVELITYTRKKRDPNAKTEKEIPVREIIIPVKQEDRVCGCGKEKEVIRYETSNRLNYKPEVFEMLVEKREVVACKKGCEDNIVTASVPERILPKCRVTESLLAYIAVSKVLDRQPTYHLEKRIEEKHGWHIPRQTMCRWLIQLSIKLQPLVNLMKDVIMEYDVAAIDATTLQVLNEPNRKAETKSYAYCILGGPDDKNVILYEYNAEKQKDYATETITGFKGYIHCDAAATFKGIGSQSDVTLCKCNAHARRKYEQIYKANRKLNKSRVTLAKQALQYYQRLYKVERYAKDEKMSPDERKKLRDEKSIPILNELHAWLLEKQMVVLPKSPIGKSIEYTLRHWEGLIAFLADGRIEIDNNTNEQSIKPFVIARKNFMFANSQSGADALGVLFTMIMTSRHHKLEPYQYMTDILKKIPHCNSWSDYENLLPWNWRVPDT